MAFTTRMDPPDQRHKKKGPLTWSVSADTVGYQEATDQPFTGFKKTLDGGFLG